MGNGWIKLHRKIVDWEWYDSHDTFRLFLHLLLTVNHKPVKWRGTVIEKGQRVASRAKLSEETGLSDRKIRTALRDLQTSSEVTIKTSNRYSVITICKWDTYQSLNDGDDQPNDQQGVAETTSKRPTIKQEGKEEKKVRTSKARAHSLDEIIEFCKGIGLPSTDGEATWNKWEGNGHKNAGKAMKCWKSTIRSWKLNGYMPSQKYGTTVVKGKFGGNKESVDYAEIHRNKNEGY